MDNGVSKGNPYCSRSIIIDNVLHKLNPRFCNLEIWASCQVLIDAQSAFLYGDLIPSTKRIEMASKPDYLVVLWLVRVHLTSIAINFGRFLSFTGIDMDVATTFMEKNNDKFIVHFLWHLVILITRSYVRLHVSCNFIYC